MDAEPSTVVEAMAPDTPRPGLELQQQPATSPKESTSASFKGRGYSSALHSLPEESSLGFESIPSTSGKDGHGSASEPTSPPNSAGQDAWPQLVPWAGRRDSKSPKASAATAAAAADKPVGTAAYRRRSTGQCAEDMDMAHLSVAESARSILASAGTLSVRSRAEHVRWNIPDAGAAEHDAPATSLSSPSAASAAGTVAVAAAAAGAVNIPGTAASPCDAAGYAHGQGSSGTPPSSFKGQPLSHAASLSPQRSPSSSNATALERLLQAVSQSELHGPSVSARQRRYSSQTGSRGKLRVFPEASSSFEKDQWGGGALAAGGASPNTPSFHLPTPFKNSPGSSSLSIAAANDVLHVSQSLTLMGSARICRISPTAPGHSHAHCSAQSLPYAVQQEGGHNVLTSGGITMHASSSWTRASIDSAYLHSSSSHGRHQRSSKPRSSSLAEYHNLLRTSPPGRQGRDMKIKAFDSSSGSRYHHTLSPLQVEGSGGADAEGVFGPISPQSGGASPSSASPSGRKQIKHGEGSARHNGGRGSVFDVLPELLDGSAIRSHGAGAGGGYVLPHHGTSGGVRAMQQLRELKQQLEACRQENDVLKVTLKQEQDVRQELADMRQQLKQAHQDLQHLRMAHSVPAADDTDEDAGLGLGCLGLALFRSKRVVVPSASTQQRAVHAERRPSC